jgi:hypothetical protein
MTGKELKKLAMAHWGADHAKQLAVFLHCHYGTVYRMYRRDRLKYLAEYKILKILPLKTK